MNKLIRKICRFALPLLSLPALILLPAACGNDDLPPAEANFSPQSIADYVASGNVETAGEQCGEAIVTIKNAVGDAHSLHALLEIKLPETIDPPLPQGRRAPAFSPRSIEYYAADIAYDDIVGMSFDQAVDYISNNKSDYLAVNSAGTKALDSGEANKIWLYINFTAPRSDISGQPLTVLIDDLGYGADDGFVTVYAGPLVVSWTPDAEGPVYTFELDGSKGRKGSVLLTQYFLRLEGVGPDTDALSIQTAAVIFAFKDGSTIDLGQIGGGSGGSYGGGHYEYQWQFNNTLNLSRLASISIGDDVIAVEDMKTD